MSGDAVSRDFESSKKDPRKIARKYQLELCKKALEENIIVYLGTGCGKTHIAVLLIHEMGHLIRKPQKNICVFVAPTVALVQQQARVIAESLDFKVGVYCGSSKRLNSHVFWANEHEQYEVFVMTPLILVRNLTHCFMKMESISLLIFDECHHAQVGSNHPYAEIMKVFYNSDIVRRPHIFGMTASPIVAKGAFIHANLPKSINSLENLLNAKVYSVENKGELENFVTSPVIKIYDYGPITNDSSNYKSYYNKLEEIKRQCISSLSRKADDHQSIRNTKRLLIRVHDDMIFCLENIGLCGVLQPHILTGDDCGWDQTQKIGENFSDDESVFKKYLVQARSVLSSDLTRDAFLCDLYSAEIMKEPVFSKKLLRLIGILSSFRFQGNMKCIVFVNRIIIARSLSYVLQRLKFLAFWKCDFLVGVHCGLRKVSRKSMNIILEKFRTGELNLLVATKVGEEGLDIQTCCLVIRFDLPESVSSFIQSRGRARMPQSEYAFIINSGNQRELGLIESFKRAEYQMNMEITDRTSTEVFKSSEDSVYKVSTSGASASSVYSISLLHQYCSKLPHDEFFEPKPRFFYYDDLGGTVCHIILPSNAPIYRVSSSPHPSMETSKKDACLKAIEELHNLGALSDHLLPMQDDEHEQTMNPEIFDSEFYEDEDSRLELHEMLVPSVLKEPWTDSEKFDSFYSYYILFTPVPEDRVYKKFCLFLKKPLPEDAQKLELDLHLARSRSVMTKFVPFGIIQFDRNEIVLAQHFQEMFLKIIHDRSKFVPDYVPLGTNSIVESSLGTFYFLLPVAFQPNMDILNVDWPIIKRCLSSKIFKTPEKSPVHKGDSSSDVQFRLADGYVCVREIENSLVYTAYNNTFFFITNVVEEKNGYSPVKDSETTTYVDHLIDRFDIRLKYPEQPLLRGKSLFVPHNLLHNRKPEESEFNDLVEYFIDIPAELCQLKIIGFSKDIGSSLSLLPSIMTRLENFLVAIELQKLLSSSFPEGAEVTANRVLEALTTEKCQERFSLERLELLGDAFLKFSVGRHLFLLHESLDEGELTRRRSNMVSNSNLLKLANKIKLQVYIRDQPFDPCQFSAFGHPCQIICNKESQQTIHDQKLCATRDHAKELKCSKGHHWLHKKTISDVVEALVGAFIVDSGFKAASAFLRWVGIEVEFDESQVIKACKASANYHPLITCKNIDELEKSLGYQFQYRGLLLQAILHPSYSMHGGGCYQRLEFLGDAILDYIITSYLYSVYPMLKPGHLTDMRSAHVSNEAFAKVAIDRSLEKFLISDSNSLSVAIEDYLHFIRRPTSETSSIEGPKCPKALGDVVESCFGAILLDTGFDLERIWNITISFMVPIMNLTTFKLNPMREFYELCQSNNLAYEFPTIKKGKAFTVEVKIIGKNISATASSTNICRKDAIRYAAEQVSTLLKGQGYLSKSKSLDEIVRLSPKMEAKLVGYDEARVILSNPDTLGFEKLNLQENLGAESIHMSNSSTVNASYLHGNIIRRPHESKNLIGRTKSHAAGVSYARTARTSLFEFCVASFWKPPVFDCCKEEGPSHSKLFTYKVILEIEEEVIIILECFSEPRLKKKDAAEHAAEGALWYLKREYKDLAKSI